ncbi:MAG: HAMP domain-containing histidine kinase [Eubacterium sp.]|nr:HAMP domain-containing histidine kinase [Eubacterium sp.]
MATNAKKFKYSSICKILCVILCAVSFFFAVKIGVLAVLSFVYEEDSYSKPEQSDKMTDWTQSDIFFSELSRDAGYAIKGVAYDEDYKIVKNKLLQNKEKIVKSAYKQVVNLKNENKKHFDAEDVGNYEGIDEPDEDSEQTTAAVQGEPETTEINIESFDKYNNSAPLEDCFSIEIDGSYYSDMFVKSNDTEETLAKRFDESYQSWAQKYIDNIYYNSDGHKAGSELCYYSSFGELTEKNVENFSENAVFGSDIYFILKDGKALYKGIDKTVAEGLSERIRIATEISDKITLYLYIPKVSALNKTDLASTLNAGNKYSLIKQFHSVATNYYDNLTKYAALSIVLLVLSFVFGIYYLTIAGKRSKKEPAKLRFYDYVPLELGLGIAGGAGVGAFAVFVNLIESQLIIPYSMITAEALLAIACVCWAGLFMVCCSAARNINSDRKFYKHLLTFWIGYAIWKAASFIAALTAKTYKKIENSISDTFAYKPTRFKRNVILLACLWLLANVLLIFFGMLFAVAGIPAITVIAIILLIVGNYLTLKKVAQYIKNLDLIIDASSRHEDVMLDFETLDNSLRILAEGMRYTNAELQNAINKAVKDERLRTELITNVSHDLKTPLTSIITYVDLLSKCDIKDEKAQEYIKVLDEKGYKLKRLIDDLIEASKVTSGNITINPSVMNLSELCLQATVDAQSEFEKAGLELIVKQGEKPVIVFADGTKTNRIIENLLSNARKYSAKASRVYVNVYEENNMGVFEIKNISARALDITPEELTERFVRGDESRSEEGNGLGLSIAKELASLQNGRLELSIDGDLFKAKVILPTK